MRLRWKYTPHLLPSGEVELELRVGARLVRPDDVDTGAEPREIDLNVFAY